MGRLPLPFQSQDTIYHYCSLNTALENILYYKKLRLSPRSKATDPIENSFSIYASQGVNSFHNRTSNFSIEERQKVEDLKSELRNLYHQNRQLCFCENDVSINNLFSFDYYGCIKPRMWDQYADKYKGVCLAFSKEQITSKKGWNSHGTDLEYSNIHYITSDTMDLRDSQIRPEELQNGEEAFKEKYTSDFKRWMFEKHKDYKDEGEFRICSYTSEEFDYIDISDCLVGIVCIADLTSAFAQSALVEYGKKYSADVTILNWSGDTIVPIEAYSTFDLKGKDEKNA